MPAAVRSEATNSGVGAPALAAASVSARLTSSPATLETMIRSPGDIPVETTTSAARWEPLDTYSTAADRRALVASASTAGDRGALATSAPPAAVRLAPVAPEVQPRPITRRA